MTITTRRLRSYGRSINLVNNFKVEKVIFNCGTYNDLEKELNINKNKLYFLQTKEYDNENDTVGIILCKQDNEYVIKYCPDDSLLLENTNWCDIIFSWRVIYVITRVLDDYRCDYSDTLLIKYIKIGSSEFKIKLRKEL